MAESICVKCENFNWCGKKIVGSTAILTRCSSYEEKATVTNADRIRSMTDEELAEWYYRDTATEAYTQPPWCIPVGMPCKHIDMDEPDCKDCLTSWLKQEVSDETMPKM